MLNRRGFTLAEVLITIGILGVIAAVTIPALSVNMQKHAMETQLSKFYSQLGEGIQRYLAIQQESSLRDTDFKTEKFVREYMNVVQTCESADDDACFAEEYNNIKDKSSTFSKRDFFNTGKAYILADGTTFWIYKSEENEENEENNYIDYPINIYVDVNGLKGPNEIGYDLQSFSVFYDGTIDEGMITPEVRKTQTPEKIKKIVEDRFDSCLNNTYGGCFGHLLRNGFKFDY